MSSILAFISIENILSFGIITVFTTVSLNSKTFESILYLSLCRGLSSSPILIRAFISSSTTRDGLPFVLPPKRFTIKLVITERALTAGENINIKTLTILTRDRDILTGLPAESVFAATSKTIIRNADIKAARSMLLEFSPIKEIIMTVIIEAINEFTILLATTIVPKNLSGASSILSIILAVLDPSVASRLSFIMLAATIDISDAAVSAPINNKITSNANLNMISIL